MQSSMSELGLSLSNASSDDVRLSKSMVLALQDGAANRSGVSLRSGAQNSHIMSMLDASDADGSIIGDSSFASRSRAGIFAPSPIKVSEKLLSATAVRPTAVRAMSPLVFQHSPMASAQLIGNSMSMNASQTGVYGIVSSESPAALGRRPASRGPQRVLTPHGRRVLQQLAAANGATTPGRTQKSPINIDQPATPVAKSAPQPTADCAQAGSPPRQPAAAPAAAVEPVSFVFEYDHTEPADLDEQQQQQQQQQASPVAAAATTAAVAMHAARAPPAPPASPAPRAPASASASALRVGSVPGLFVPTASPFSPSAALTTATVTATTEQQQQEQQQENDAASTTSSADGSLRTVPVADVPDFYLAPAASAGTAAAATAASASSPRARGSPAQAQAQAHKGSKLRSSPITVTVASTTPKVVRATAKAGAGAGGWASPPAAPAAPAVTPATGAAKPSVQYRVQSLFGKMTVQRVLVSPPASGAKGGKSVSRVAARSSPVAVAATTATSTAMAAQQRQRQQHALDATESLYEYEQPYLEYRRAVAAAATSSTSTGVSASASASAAAVAVAAPGAGPLSPTSTASHPSHVDDSNIDLDELYDAEYGWTLSPSGIDSGFVAPSAVAAALSGAAAAVTAATAAAVPSPAADTRLEATMASTVGGDLAPRVLFAAASPSPRKGARNASKGSRSSKGSRASSTASNGSKKGRASSSSGSGAGHFGSPVLERITRLRRTGAADPVTRYHQQAGVGVGSSSSHGTSTTATVAISRASPSLTAFSPEATVHGTLATPSPSFKARGVDVDADADAGAAVAAECLAAAARLRALAAQLTVGGASLSTQAKAAIAQELVQLQQLTAAAGLEEAESPSAVFAVQHKKAAAAAAAPQPHATATAAAAAAADKENSRSNTLGAATKLAQSKTMSSARSAAAVARSSSSSTKAAPSLDVVRSRLRSAAAGSGSVTVAKSHPWLSVASRRQGGLSQLAMPGAGGVGVHGAGRKLA